MITSSSAQHRGGQQHPPDTDAEIGSVTLGPSDYILFVAFVSTSIAGAVPSNTANFNPAVLVIDWRQDVVLRHTILAESVASDVMGTTCTAFSVRYVESTAPSYGGTGG